jgi:hypothetical protein
MDLAKKVARKLVTVKRNHGGQEVYFNIIVLGDFSVTRATKTEANNVRRRWIKDIAAKLRRAGVK